MPSFIRLVDSAKMTFKKEKTHNLFFNLFFLNNIFFYHPKELFSVLPNALNRRAASCNVSSFLQKANRAKGPTGM